MNIVLRGGDMISGLKHLTEYLKRYLSEHSVMVELGSYVGESASIFAQSGLFDKIYCVDMWVGGYQEDDFASQNMIGVEDMFDKNFLNDHRIIKVKCDTLSAITKIKELDKI